MNRNETESAGAVSEWLESEPSGDVQVLFSDVEAMLKNKLSGPSLAGYTTSVWTSTR